MSSVDLLVKKTLRPSTDECRRFVTAYTDLFMPSMPTYEDALPGATMRRWLEDPRQHLEAIREYAYPLIALVRRVLDLIGTRDACKFLTMMDCEVFGEYFIMFHGRIDVAREALGSPTVSSDTVSVCLRMINHAIRMLRTAHVRLLAGFFHVKDVTMEEVEAIAARASHMADMFDVHEAHVLIAKIVEKKVKDAARECKTQ